MTSVRAARLVSPSRRRAWESELVRFQIDELNALYDGLTEAPTPSERRARLARARLRIERIVRAAAWIPRIVTHAARAVVDAGFDEPEDAFGAALLLGALSAKDRRGHLWIDRLLRALPSEVVATLADLALEPGSRP
jgi:hypothetical protein